MNLRLVSSTLVLVASAFATQVTFAATPNLAMHSPVHATYTRPTTIQTVKVKLRNDSTAPMPIQIGPTSVTLQPGQLTTLRLAVGEKIVAVAATSSTPAGTLLSVVDSSFKNATVSFR